MNVNNNEADLISESKALALAAYLRCNREDVKPLEYDPEGFKAEGREYRVYDDAEADEACRTYIRETLWAFNADFIVGHIRKRRILSGASFEILCDMLKKVQEDSCESCNEVIFMLIDDFDHFVDDAINCDGRGHFSASYDGEEGESACGQYYIYRVG